MAFPTGQTLAEALTEARVQAKAVKTQATSWIATMAAGSVSSDYIFGLYKRLKDFRSQMQTLGSLTGIVDYANAQLGIEDIAGEWTTLRTAVDASTGWIDANFPVDGSGYLLGWKLTGGVLDPRLFNASATAGLRTALQGVVNAIE